MVTGLLLRLMGARPGTSTEAGILMASPSETTLIVLGAAISARLITRDAAQFWQIVTAIGLTVTPILAMDRPPAGAPGRPGRQTMPPSSRAKRARSSSGSTASGDLVADMLRRHDKPFVAIDLDADRVMRRPAGDGFPVIFGDARRDGDARPAGAETRQRSGPDHGRAGARPAAGQASCARATRTCRSSPAPAMPATPPRSIAPGPATPCRKRWKARLQLSEAVLVDIGVPMGFVIASIHEKRDEYRADHGRGRAGRKAGAELSSGTLREYQQRIAASRPAQPSPPRSLPPPSRHPVRRLAPCRPGRRRPCRPAPPRPRGPDRPR
jgi:CPA2 family monovalent cation:H+ antiporter-2